VTSLVKNYDDLTAVNGITFSVNKGEVFSLLGPNGAGKTTTIEILETLRHPTSGSVTIFGCDLFNSKNHELIRNRIGVMPQNFNAFDWLTVRENLNYFKSIYRSNIDVMDLIAIVNLEDKKDSLYKNLSGGLKQRLGIAITLINDPDLIFLDEPTSGLDPKARRDTWNLIIKLRNNGKSILLTTHYMEEAQALSDRIAIMINGKIIDSGTSDFLISKYGGSKSVIVKNFTDEFRNLFDTSVALDEGNRLSINYESSGDLLKIIKALESTGSVTAEFEIKTPTMEDVFLKITGKRISIEGKIS
tara:strand:+ start:255 stop:1160 length:906 start_codon:yes stop_codon:yes gene_type:complete